MPSRTNGQNQFTYDGILHVNSRVKLIQVTDGSSTTLLVGERPPAQDGLNGWWFAGSGPYPWFGAIDVVMGSNEKIAKNGAFTPNSAESFYQRGSLNDPTGEHAYHFWSFHHGGSNFLFADASVRFISYSIGGEVLRKLATCNKGESVNADF